MNQYYQNIVTRRSWQQLQLLKKRFNFILIGGWAVYLYTHQLKSKDIDIIIDYSELEKIRKEYQLNKNERLKKYEIKKEGIDIDIYLPHYSDIGLPVEYVIKHANQIETFPVLKKEVLLITKLKAYMERKTSIKGQKDKIDIISLILLPDFNFGLFITITQAYHLHNQVQHMRRILVETVEVRELGLNRHYFAKKKKEIFDNKIWVTLN